MNTEEKAKRYDEALERAKELLEIGLKDTRDKRVVLSFFPELKESEDERIKRNIIAALKGEGYYDCDLTNECIAWVEKQGYTKKDVDDAYLKGICDAKHELEKQGEQESADKHEPKFHVGDWIVWQNKCYKVNYNGCGYELIDQNGLSTSLEYGTVDTSARFYDVSKDAKDGDVLVFKNNIGGIIICKSPSDYDTRSYCRLIRDNLINKEESGWDSTLLVPATKEQRDLLFQKMKEAGYEWSEDTHELKKISQRMVSAEAKEALYDEPTDEEMKELLRTEYEKGRADTIAEMEKDWSEEDERICQCLIQDQKEALEDVRNDKYGHSEIISDLKEMYRGRIDWLKQLKQRHSWKPSEEQMKAFEHFVRSIGESGYASPYENNTKLLYSLLNDLKKLTE